MDTAIALAQLQLTVRRQVALSGADPVVEEAAEAVLAALEPALRQLAYSIAEQASAEVNAQIAGYEVVVTLQDGDPHLRAHAADDEPASIGESLDARVTLRLPDSLKSLMEAAAEEQGESVNSWMVKTLSSRASRRRRGRRVVGRIDT